MKKSIFAIVALIPALFACNKETISINDGSQKGLPATIEAVIDNESSVSKTTYTSDGKFSWVLNDKIDLAVYKTTLGSGTRDRYALRATSVSSDGYTATFESDYTSDNLSSRVGQEYTEHGYAFYPGNDDPTMIWKNFWTASNHSVNLCQSASEYKVPMIAKKLDDGKYHFSTSTGAVKISFNSIPSEARQFGITARSNSLSGYFYVVDDADNKAVIGTTTGGGNTNTRYVSFSPTAGMSKEFLIPIPVGTSMAGMRIFIKDADGKLIFSTITRRSLGDIARGEMYNVPSQNYSAVSFNKSAVIGTYSTSVTPVTSPILAASSETGDLVIEDSDNPTYDVMITKFAGVSGKIYGNLDADNWTITFDKDQSFGANPYSNNATYPELVVVAYSSEAENLVLHRTSSGKLVCLSNGLGFRAIKDIATWTSNHSGDWPWNVGYTEFIATKK